MIVEKRLSRLEKAVPGQLNGQSTCPWLPDLQIDVPERWCLGLGLFPLITQCGCWCGSLPSAMLVDHESGLNGILVCEVEWNVALPASDLGLAEAVRAMGIEEKALRKLRYSGLFQMR